MLPHGIILRPGTQFGPAGEPPPTTWLAGSIPGLCLPVRTASRAHNEAAIATTPGPQSCARLAVPRRRSQCRRATRPRRVHGQHLETTRRSVPGTAPHDALRSSVRAPR